MATQGTNCRCPASGSSNSRTGDGADSRPGAGRPRGGGHQGEPLTGDRTASCSARAPASFRSSTATRKAWRWICSSQGREVALRLIATADVVSENFSPGAMKKVGLDYDSLSRLDERLIYVSHKGFLPGPYERPRWTSRADDGRAGLHDRAPRRSAAGRHQRQRHHGRHVRRHAMAALAQRGKTGKGLSRCKARCSRTTCSWWPST